MRRSLSFTGFATSCLLLAACGNATAQVEVTEPVFIACTRTGCIGDAIDEAQESQSQYEQFMAVMREMKGESGDPYGSFAIIEQEDPEQASDATSSSVVDSDRILSLHAALQSGTLHAGAPLPEQDFTQFPPQEEESDDREAEEDDDEEEEDMEEGDDEGEIDDEEDDNEEEVEEEQPEEPEGVPARRPTGGSCGTGKRTLLTIVREALFCGQEPTTVPVLIDGECPISACIIRWRSDGEGGFGGPVGF